MSAGPGAARAHLPVLGDGRPGTGRRRFCVRPFQHLEITPTGNAHLCCSGWLPRPVGNVWQSSIAEIWNGPAAQEVRRSILDDSFAFCTGCPFLKTASHMVRYVDTIDDPEERSLLDSGAATAPRVRWLNLAYDVSCNLSCPSCRTGVMVAQGAVYGYLERMQERLLAQGLLEEIDWLYLTGSGDPFASRLYRDLLRSIDPGAFPHLRIRLHTNGLLFTADAWEQLGPVRARVEQVEISIDAGDGATYAANRRGGDWDTLRQNLGFIASLRRAQAIRLLQLSFVVQANNWRQMPAFVALGEGFAADLVAFQALRNWNTFSDDEYRTRAVHRPEHPEHAAFRASLADERLRRPHVRLADVAD